MSRSRKGNRLHCRRLAFFRSPSGLPTVLDFRDDRTGSLAGEAARSGYAIRVRHYSARTEETYVRWIRRFILFHGKRHPSWLGAAEVAEFLTALATRSRVSASTQACFPDLTPRSSCRSLITAPYCIPATTERRAWGFISILKSPDSEELRIVGSEVRLATEHPQDPDGTFSAGPDLVAFQREVPALKRC